MEEEKASAYYDELSRKGQGAAKFKQGLGFSSTSSPSHSAAATASTDKTSFYNNFVCASNTNTNPSTASPPDTVKPPNHNYLEAVRNKLKKKPSRVSRENPLEDRKDDRRSSSSRHRSRSRERSRRRRDEEEEGSKSSRREHRHHGDSIRRSRSRSPRSRNGRSRGDSRRCDKDPNAKNVDDYSQLIDGYSQMTTAEKVKAKMRFQLSQTEKKDIAKGINTRWERFDFNKDVPLDDDEELTEVAEDDASIVKNMGKSFRFSAVEAKHEDEIRAAHDKAIFGVPTALSVFPEKATDEPNETEVDNATNTSTALICDTIITKPQSSWRDRVRKVQD